MAAKGLLPTPLATEGRRGLRKVPRPAKCGRSLTEKILPTPTAGDAKCSGSRMAEGSEAHHGTSLTDALVRGSTTGRPESRQGWCLNPRFVEWMMGLPIGWTDLGCSAMPLCLK